MVILNFIKRYDHYVTNILVVMMFFSRLPIYKVFKSRVDGLSFAIDRDAIAVPVASVFMTFPMIVMIVILSLIFNQPDIFAIGVILSLVLLTGCLHEDGLADCADGFGGGYIKSRKLEIMSDSAIGAYGTIALIICFLMRFMGLSLLFQNGGLYDALILIVIIFATSRTSAISIAYFLSPAKEKGLGSDAGSLSFSSALAMWIITAILIILSMLFLWSFLSLVMMMGAILGMIIAIRIAHHHIGGYTGDVFGLTQVMAEICGLLTVVAFL